MYRFLMVDDEEIVRRGFRNRINWTDLGFEFLAPCENGEQAIEALEALRPDVVMTDIAMPRMDGLAVAAYAAEHYPETVVVILSGYDEFEYAQKAIKSSVFEYVLKPVTSRDLTGLLGRLKARLDVRARSQEEARATERRAKEAAELMKSRALLDLVTGPGGLPSAARFQELFGFPPDGLCCCVVIVEEEPPVPGIARVPSACVSETLEEVAGTSRRALAFSPAEGRQGILVLETDAASCDRLAGMLAGRIAAADPHVIVGIGRVCGTWHEASVSFREAVAALSYRLAAPGGAFRYSGKGSEDPQSLDGLAELKERARRAVVSGEPQEAESQAGALLRLLSSEGVSPARIRHEVEALFGSIRDSLQELGVSPAAMARDLDLDLDLAVQSLRTSEDAQGLLRRLSIYAGSILDGRAIPAPEWKVRDFKDYVARHYGERALSVQSIAAKLSISASYLSKLVKKHLDRSVVDYLVDYRMEKAKELLSASDLMMYEIAEAIGYPDAQYFSTVFKRQIGLTPSEFRTQRRVKSGPA